MLNQAVDALGQNALQVALSWSSAGIRGHHPRYRCVGAKKGSKFSGGLKLSRKNRLEHSQEKMLFSTLVLVSIQCEHDGLKKGIDFGQADEATEGGDVSGFGLEEEEEVGILLQLSVVRIMALSGIYILQGSFDFTLLTGQIRSTRNQSI